jgi:hypothetical protein
MRRRLSYANVVATLALVFAMSGGALAANHYLINSTKQISPKVLKKLKGATGKRGTIGATGAPGATGAVGSSGAVGKEGAVGKNGTNGERGPSTAFNINSGEAFINFPAKAEENLVVSSLSLPAGNFAVFAKLIANNNAASLTTIHCELQLGGSVIDPGFNLVRLAKEGDDDRQTLVVAGTGSLSSAGQATTVCRASTTEGNYIDSSITATQVGGLG